MRATKVATIFLLGATVGGAGSYWVAASTLKQRYERQMEVETEELKEHYKAVHKHKGYDTPADRIAELAEKEAADTEIDETFDVNSVYSAEERAENNMKVAAYAMEQDRTVGTPEARPATRQSIFDYNNINPHKEGVIDYGAIRVITDEEFDAEDEHSKSEYTYYSGDDTLADDSEDIVQDVKAVIGPDALALLSNQDLVYVRNDAIRQDYSITVVDGKYETIVVGGL